MRLIVLGAGAGGGLPQWNCGCANCAAARAGRLAPMTQSSLAVSANGVDWAVLNASPDIRAQLAATPALHPRELRHSPVSDVVVTNGDIDHIAGLLTLREKTRFRLWASAPTRAAIQENPVFGVLDPALVEWREIVPDRPFEISGGIRATAFAVPGKVPLYAEGAAFADPAAAIDTAALDGRTIGLELEQGGRRAFYLPGCADLPDWLVARLQGGDLLLFDGTVWEDDDMARSGTGAKTGARMGHLAISGPHGSLARLAGLEGRRLFVHLNNTNPVLDPADPARAAVTRAGWEIAHDGLEIAL